MFSIGIVYPEIKIISNFEDIKGFEIKAKKLNYVANLTLNNVENITYLKSEFEKNWNNDECDWGIILTNKNNNQKCYFVNIREIAIIDENSLNLKAFTFGASKGVVKAWKNYFSKGINEPNLWTDLKQSERQGWLELSMAFQNTENSNLKSEIEIDGKHIKSIDDFYSSLGEAVNGFGGYFGRNFNALIDCIISSEFGGNDIKKFFGKTRIKADGN